jgi:hypothetical protein
LRRIPIRALLVVLVSGLLLGAAPVISFAGLLDMTNYEQSTVLITEPLVFSSLTRIRSYDEVTCVAVDEAGNLYAAGVTKDTGNSDDPSDSFLMKINGTDFSSIYYYVFGGSNFDSVNDMVVNSGKVYLVGNTGSIDFPVENAYCDTFQNSTDCFVMCLDSSSLEVIFSTYLGGEVVDTGESIFIDN